MREHRVHGLAGLAALIVSIMAPAYAWSNSTGMIGHSGKQGAAVTCVMVGCHSGGVAPTVSFDGPMQIAPGAIATFTFNVTSNSANQTAAGLNVAVSGGTLATVAGQDELLVAGELTHSKPKANNNGSANWQFSWRAPAASGSYDIFGSGNSVNLNLQNTGDFSASTVFRVLVAADQPPTPTETVPAPTETSTAVPPTSTATSAPPTSTLTPTRRDTPVPTATRTFRPTPTPTPTTVPTPSGPQPGDGNCDGSLGAPDVIAIVARIGVGSAGGCALVDADCNTTLDAADLDAVLARVFGAPAPATCTQLQ